MVVRKRTERFYDLFKGRWAVVTAAIFLMCLLFNLPPMAWAAVDTTGNSVQIKAELCWKEQGLSGRYAPAVVYLKNTGKSDLSGVVEAINYRSTSSSKELLLNPKKETNYYPTASFGERVSLPAGSEKKLVLWSPMMDSSRGRTDFVFKTGDRELARVSKMPQVSSKVIYDSFGVSVSSKYIYDSLGVGVFGQIPPAMESAQAVMSDEELRYVNLQLTGEIFPRRGEELNACTTILVTGKGASSLNVEQRNALAQWVKNGGHLVLSGGLDMDKALSALPAQTISVNVKQIEQSNMQSVAAWLQKEVAESATVTVARLFGDGEYWGPQDNPLGMRFNLGDGAVTVLGFDPNQAPWQSGAMGEGLWQKLLALPDNEKVSNSNNLLSRLVRETASMPSEAFPGWQSVGLFLLVFLLVAGPGTYWLLRHIGRPEYTWVAVPFLAVIFSGAAYLYMIQTGGNVLVNVLQVVDSRESGSPSGYTAVGYFAPTQAVLNTVLDDPDRSVTVRASGRRSPNSTGENDEPPYSVIRGSDLTVRFNDVTQWGMRSIAFRNENVSPTVQSLTADIEIQGNEIIGKVRNLTDMHLDYVTIFLGSEYKMLGDLAPGEEVVTEMKCSIPQYNPESSYRSHRPESSYRSHRPFRARDVFLYPDGPPAQRQKEMAAQSLTNRLDISEQRRASLMDIWMDSVRDSVRRSGPMVADWRPLTVLAWSEKPAAELGIQEFYRPPYYLTMFVLKPEIKLPTGQFAIPAGLIMPEVSESSVRDWDGHDNLMGIEDGSLTYAFKPSFSEQVKINEVTLQFEYFPNQNNHRKMDSLKSEPVPEGVLEIYNPVQDVWQPLSGSGTFSLSGEYASNGGEVKVRVISQDINKDNEHEDEREDDVGFYFLPPTVSYGGEKV